MSARKKKVGVRLARLLGPDTDERRFLFAHCKSKEELHNWVLVYLGLDMPDGRVDPASTSSPMELIWEVYDAALRGSDWSQILAYAARDTWKSLSASILEVLMVLHMERSVAHMAAIESQAKNVQRYIKKFFHHPLLQAFISSENEREIIITRYFDPKTETSYCESELDNLPIPILQRLETKTNSIKIIICSTQGTNCIDPGAQVQMADGAQKLAGDVVQGDRIRSFDITNTEWTATTIGSVSTSLKPSMRVTFEGGGSVVLSEDHPVFTERGWTRTRALRVGMKCFAAEGTPTTHESFAVALEQASCVNPESALVGSLMGDASLAWPKSPKGVAYGVGPRVKLSHCRQQLPYLYRKQAILEALGLRTLMGETDIDGQTPLQSSVSAQLIPLFDLFYGSGRKAVTQAVLDRIDLEALAFWVMDDGSGNAEEVGSYKDRRLSLATCSFTESEHELMVGWFKQRWDLDASIEWVSNQSKKRYPIIALTLDSSRKLSAMLEPYFTTPCLKYKLPIPLALLDYRCLVCGDTIPCTEQQKGAGFRYCHAHNGNSSRRRIAWRQRLSSHVTRKVHKLEYLGLRNLVDLHVDTDDPHLRNFVANSSILLHNSDHVPYMCVDEVDVVANREAYEEAKMIPTTYMGKSPITLFTSTRKYSIGLVQQEIDKVTAGNSDMQVRHWNLLDGTQSCNAARHRPDKPKLPIYTNDSILKAITEDKWLKLPEVQQEKYEKTEGYWGCINNCKLYAACKGRLVNQKSTSPLLKSIAHTTMMFRNVAPDKARAQLLCWAPSKEGLIYAALDTETHRKTAAEIAEMITGDPYPESFGKEQLIKFALDRGCDFLTGIDHGYSHNFAVVTGFVDGNRLYMFDAIAIPELEISQKVDLLEKRIKGWDPTIWADPEEPGTRVTFVKHGFRAPKWDKKRGSVNDGINAVRAKIMPALGSAPEIYFLKDDDGVDLLFSQLSRYHWVLDAGEKPTDVPDEEDDDQCDALRYLVMNRFSASKMRSRGQSGGEGRAAPPIAETPYSAENWQRQKINELTGGHDAVTTVEDAATPGLIRRGGFMVSM